MGLVRKVIRNKQIGNSSESGMHVLQGWVAKRNEDYSARSNEEVGLGLLIKSMEEHISVIAKYFQPQPYKLPSHEELGMEI